MTATDPRSRSASPGCASHTATTSSSTASISRSLKGPSSPSSAQRRRQDDHRPDPVDPDRRRQRRGPGGRARRRARARRGPRAHRCHRPVLGGRQAVHRRGEPAVDGGSPAPRHGRGPRRVDELIQRFDLVEAARKPVATYSGGMKRRLDLAMTLIGEPRIIFLDEPTAGLDPRSRRVMWQTVRELVAGGVTIFLTTQDLEEADRLAHRIAVLDHGVLVAQGTADELKRLVSAATSGSRSPTRPSSSERPGPLRARPARGGADAADPQRWRGRFAASAPRQARRRLDRGRRAVGRDTRSRRRVPVADRRSTPQKAAIR